MRKCTEWLMSKYTGWLIMVGALVMSQIGAWLIWTGAYEKGFNQAKAIYEQRCDAVKTHAQTLMNTYPILKEERFGYAVMVSTSKLICEEDK